MSKDKIRLEASDVTIEDVPDYECDYCTFGLADRVVKMNLRSLGETVVIGRFCGTCAQQTAERIREGLPR